MLFLKCSYLWGIAWTKHAPPFPANRPAVGLAKRLVRCTCCHKPWALAVHDTRGPQLAGKVCSILPNVSISFSALQAAQRLDHHRRF